ncbi:MAG: MBL fold metallo-hydrolase [Bacillota bacterium]|nr:MBL fold metallo-hydrolase [Bacillota bacterium]
MEVKINYLYNSAFSVETPRYLLIFDYYLDSVDGGNKVVSNGAVGEEDLITEKNIMVFSSHSHADHFNPIILQWKNVNSNIKYILSSDINIGETSESINKISAYEELQIGEVSIKAFGSTDIGVSFLVRVEGISIFHAGDLNCWYWWDEPEEQNKKAEVWFKEEIEKIKEENIDIAFFPVDSRLKDYYSLGPKYFIEKLKPKSLIPMHFREDFGITQSFKKNVDYSFTQVEVIDIRGQQLLIEI